MEERHDYFDQCSPITSLDTVLQVIEQPPLWVEQILPLEDRSDCVIQNVISDCHTENSEIVPRPRLDKRFVPKTLVCHDYKGGYLEDRFVTRTNAGNQYTFYNWAHIDIFVYFSHHLITIPPLCWINAAHKNGVKILGTFITEFNAGAKICEKIFRNEDTMRIFVKHLTQITEIFRFDGWLLNVENPLPNTDLLKKFVSLLSTSLHDLNIGNLVIWYDSVIETGSLKWQNELNSLNRCFFDSCDGIFLNYVWTEEKIANSVKAAKHRNFDVFVGIDVFGRNTFGGGKFNSYKAAQIIRRHNLSMAIFAPGWTHETLYTNEDFFADFVSRDLAFWNSLWPFLYTNPIPKCFQTSFYIGADQIFYNIYGQQQQLTKLKHPTKLSKEYVNVPTLSNKCNCMQVNCEFNDIKCLITRTYLNSTLKYNHRLFSCDIQLNGNINVFFITEQNQSFARISLNLLISRNDSFKIIKLNSINKTILTENATFYEVNPTEDIDYLQIIRRQYNFLFSHRNAEISAFHFSVNPCTLMEIGCVIDEGDDIYLNAFGISQNNL